MYKTFTVLVFFSLLMTSCAAFAPSPTSTLTQTATLVPTETPTPTSTLTPLPPTETPDIVAAMLPSGIPDKEWNGIPIMPGAINGEGDDKGYTFTIHATSEEIQQYYQTELTKQGANLFATGEGNEKGTVLLIFMMGTDVVSISIIPHDDLMLVLIVK